MSAEGFENFIGNVRVKNICFDSIQQMWGSSREYDQEQAKKEWPHYIGKIGKYVKGSYTDDRFFNCSSIIVSFADGMELIVLATDVELTVSEDITPVDFLPKLNKERKRFIPLTVEQIEFADKTFLQLISTYPGEDLSDHQIHSLMQQSIRMALLRTAQHKRVWDNSWADKFE